MKILAFCNPDMAILIIKAKPYEHGTIFIIIRQSTSPDIQQLKNENLPD